MLRSLLLLLTQLSGLARCDLPNKACPSSHDWHADSFPLWLPGIAVSQLKGLLADLREEVPRIKAGAEECTALPHNSCIVKADLLTVR